MDMWGQKAKRAVAYAVLALWGLVCLFPVYWLAITAFKSAKDIATGPVYLPFFDFSPTLAAWRYIFVGSSDKLVLRFINSCLVASVSAMIVLLASCMAVYGLTRLRYRLPWMRGIMPNRFILAGMIATRLLPPVVVVLPLYIMARLTHTLDTRFALIVTYSAVNLPVGLWLLYPVFGTRRCEQEESALLDGASQFTVLFSILMPMIAGSIAAAGILVFTLCMNEYLLAVYLASDQAMTLPPWIAGQMSIREGQVASPDEEWANFSAASLLLILPLMLFAGLAQRVLGRMATFK